MAICKTAFSRSLALHPKTMPSGRISRKDEFDWKGQIEKMSAFHRYRYTSRGVGIHFIHERGEGPTPIPLILTHGWPDRFAALCTCACCARSGGSTVYWSRPARSWIFCDGALLSKRRTLCWRKDRRKNPSSVPARDSSLSTRLSSPRTSAFRETLSYPHFPVTGHLRRIRQ